MKGRVLIADDEPAILECYGTILEAENFEVQAVNSAAAAIAALDSGEFDIVITDMAMETKTAGYDVARAAQRKFRQPEVVIFTAFYIPATEWKSQGVKALFTKGQGAAVVIEAIKRISDETNRRRRAPLASRQQLTA